MARRPVTPKTPAGPERIIDIDVSQEMQGSFLEYAYSVIYSRALPDARDGLKPVQRRILYTMSEMGLRPDKGHVKSARVVGEVMGRLHPHGDSAIYDAMVRMAQGWSFRLPLVDGHGNFGSLDDGPAAYRYTEARLAPSALSMTASLDEDVVDFNPNYDGRETEPEVLPAAIPALLVNGAAGIAVGMATNIPPHNLNEVVAAARYLLKNPKATVVDLMNYLPGPDLPTGGVILGLSGIRDAYVEGRGSFKIRATVSVENVTARRVALVVTELPYNVGPEKVIEKIKDGVGSKKLTGISDVTDLSDGDRGLRLVIELKSGFNPQAVLTQLYKHTPLEEQFSINAVALVGGAPKTLGIKELLQVFLDHRLEVVRRRSEFRKRKAAERLHLVEGLLVAIIDIDEVIQVIRTSEDTAEARTRLMQIFDLSEIQTNYILEMPLRRLTKFSRIELEKERDELQSTIAALTKLLSDPKALSTTVSDELAAVAKDFGTPRRTVLQEDDGTSVAADLEIADDPVVVMLSSSGLLARFTPDTVANVGGRTRHDVVISTANTTARSTIGLVTSLGRVHRIPVMEIPALANSQTALGLKGGGALKEFVTLEKKETAIALHNIDDESILAVGTAQGVVKRVSPEAPKGDVWEVIRLEPNDRVVGAGVTTAEDQHLVFVTSDCQLLHFEANLVRPQGRGAAGMAGIKLSKGASVISFSVANEDAEVLTISGSSSALPGTDPGSAKITALSEFPTKGRATGGVRCHALRKSEDTLLLAAVGIAPLRAAADNGAPLELSLEPSKRDGTGSALTSPIGAAAGKLPL
ncbi:MAG: hypothetical protein RIS75_671 [Actinomycetota bacterium]